MFGIQYWVSVVWKWAYGVRFSSQMAKENSKLQKNGENWSAFIIVSCFLSPLIVSREILITYVILLERLGEFAPIESNLPSNQYFNWCFLWFYVQIMVHHFYGKF